MAATSFYFKAIAADGKPRTGTLAGDNERKVALELRRQRLLAAHRPEVNMAVRGKTIYLSTAKLPNRGRPPKAG